MVQVIEKFKSTDIFHSPDGCWYWLGSMVPNGYGRVHIKKKSFLAHRVSYLIHKGNPDGMFVCHRCDNRGCVNPDHLFLGTIEDNNHDRHRKGRTVSTGRPSDLCDEDIKEIRRLYPTSGLTQYQIAKMFSVRQSSISRIVNRVRQDRTFSERMYDPHRP